MKKISNPAILEITEEYNEKMRERTDRRRKLVIFEEGDHLAVKEVVVGEKTDAKWTTGYIVEKRNQNGSCTVRERRVGGVFRPDTYTSDKLIHERDFTPGKDGAVEDEETYEVEGIVDHMPKVGGKTHKYKIRWKGYDQQYDSWVSVESVGNCQRAVAKYWSMRNVGTGEGAMPVEKKRRRRRKKATR